MYDDSAGGLLEELRHKLQYEYLSDLYHHPHPQLLAAAVVDIPAQHYSLTAWTQAITYITGKKQAFSTAQQARQFLLP